MIETELQHEEIMQSSYKSEEGGGSARNGDKDWNATVRGIMRYNIQGGGKA